MTAMTRLRDVAQLLRHMAADSGGTTTIEYALIIFIVSLAIGFLLPEMGLSIQEIFTGVTSTIDAGGAAGSGG